MVGRNNPIFNNPNNPNFGGIPFGQGGFIKYDPPGPDGLDPTMGAGPNDMFKPPKFDDPFKKGGFNGGPGGNPFGFGGGLGKPGF